MSEGTRLSKARALVDAMRERDRTRRKALRRAERPLTDLGNAERFTDAHGQNLRHCDRLGGWYAWDETRWLRDETREASRRAHDTVRALFAEGIDLTEEANAIADEAERAVALDRAERTVKHARSSEHASRLRAALEIARALRPIPIAAGELDGTATLELLNTPSGTVDLRTCSVRSHRREDLITRVTGARWVPDAPAPAFERFLERILPDPDVRAFMQRWAGYVATGTIREHVLPVWYGASGANGKSTLAELVKAVLGDYACALPEAFLEDAKHRGHPTEIARLRAVRLAVASETRRSAVLAESLVKRLTGGDTLTGRFMREDFFDFEPTAKIVLFTNYKPRITGTDGGIRRRVLLVPFEVRIPEEQQDRELRARLFETEGPGVLRWIVEGVRAWRERGLDPPAAVQTATREYLEAEDAFGIFLAERCTVTRAGDRRVSVQPAALFDAWRRWCDANGDEPGTARTMTELMQARGFVSRKGGKGRRWYDGVGLNASSDEEDPRAYVD
jgi:putative DNA primase/helicase